ncbi:DUF3306 domain-containing protein [Roseomonas stagni]|uniref:DUF3306 domain-containing protein n=1 Tax=Falsiroseomonas algicola TaxID=2716930 RepID=A0A6M1LSY5_9PROT|nr:DUF3306 domain-containing protein [Falsiroseomonas algicola]NGM22704.1 DUF3306 domain-containing protein [Falsiroseomonas algicola]
MSGTEEPGFLGRWSRRKRGLEAEAPPPAEIEAEPAPEPAPVAKSGTCPIPGMEPIDLSTLPPIEELSVTSDLAPFLRPGIPAALRSAALRRMWSLDPAIRDYIGPVEYQWDFNTPGGLPAGFASELVGDVRKLLAQAIGEVEEEKPAEPAAEPLLEALPEPPMAMAPEPPAMVPPGISLAEAPPAPALPAPEPEPEAPPAPRRRHGGALPA